MHPKIMTKNLHKFAISFFVVVGSSFFFPTFSFCVEKDQSSPTKGLDHLKGALMGSKNPTAIENQVIESLSSQAETDTDDQSIYNADDHPLVVTSPEVRDNL